MVDSRQRLEQAANLVQAPRQIVHAGRGRGGRLPARQRKPHLVGPQMPFLRRQLARVQQHGLLAQLHPGLPDGRFYTTAVIGLGLH
jgi:hypothetical protein